MEISTKLGAIVIAVASLALAPSLIAIIFNLMFGYSSYLFL